MWSCWKEEGSNQRTAFPYFFPLPPTTRHSFGYIGDILGVLSFFWKILINFNETFKTALWPKQMLGIGRFDRWTSSSLFTDSWPCRPTIALCTPAALGNIFFRLSGPKRLRPGLFGTRNLVRKIGGCTPYIAPYANTPDNDLQDLVLVWSQTWQEAHNSMMPVLVGFLLWISFFLPIFTSFILLSNHSKMLVINGRTISCVEKKKVSPPEISAFSLSPSFFLQRFSVGVGVFVYLPTPKRN